MHLRTYFLLVVNAILGLIYSFTLSIVGYFNYFGYEDMINDFIIVVVVLCCIGFLISCAYTVQALINKVKIRGYIVSIIGHISFLPFFNYLLNPISMLLCFISVLLICKDQNIIVFKK